MFPGGAEEAAAQREAAQSGIVTRLLQALAREGLLPPQPPDTAALARAVHAYLARRPSMLAMAQIDDLTEEADPVNMPGHVD